MAAADERARRAGIVMARDRDRSPEQMAAAVVGTADDGSEVQALIAEGELFDGRIVLRITERDKSQEVDHIVRCYEYVLDGYIAGEDPAHIDCPGVDPIDLRDSSSVVPGLPRGIDDAIAAAVGTLDPATVTEADLLTALRSVSGTAPVVEVATVGTDVGGVVGDGDEDCVSVRFSEGRLEQWRVPPMVAQPGELGCFAEQAAKGLGKTLP